MERTPSVHRSFETWSEDFAFSEELEALEQYVPLDTAPARNKSTDQRPSLDRFINLVTSGVLEKLSDETYLDRFLKTRELQRDNQMLASQIKHLLKDKKHLEAELVHRMKELERYKHIAGNIYLKLD